MSQAAKSSTAALWSLILGIASFVCLSWFASIPAVICAHVAKANIRAANGELDGDGMATAGMILGYIFIALSLLMVPLMLAIAVPSFIKARETSQRNACINNLRILDGATQQWAIENNVEEDSAGPASMAEIMPYIGGDTVPTCPAGGTYTLPPRMDESPTCSVPEHQLPF